MEADKQNSCSTDGGDGGCSQKGKCARDCLVYASSVISHFLMRPTYTLSVRRARVRETWANHCLLNQRLPVGNVCSARDTGAIYCESSRGKTGKGVTLRGTHLMTDKAIYKNGSSWSALA